MSNVRISDYGNNVSDHCPVELDLEAALDEIRLEKKFPKPTVNWAKLSPECIENFQKIMSQKLDEINLSFLSLLHGDRCCSNNHHRESIDRYHNDIVEAVLFSDNSLPRTNFRYHKSYWSSSLNELKQRSIECCNTWRLCGCPKSGDIYECKKRCSLQYKVAIRKAKRNHEASVNHELFHSLTSLDNDSFWRVWRNMNKGKDSLVTRVEGETTETGIAGAFCRHFQRVYSGGNSPQHQSLRDEFLLKFRNYEIERINDTISPYYVSWSDMTEVVKKIKPGKSSSGLIRPEHVLYGSPKLVIHLQLLYNAMIQHGMIVKDFCRGTITPIVKDSQGDVSSCTNYRGITLCGLFSKLFEMILDEKIKPFIRSDWLQFEFKKKTSTSHAIHTLKSTVDYFNKRKSDVFVSFLDCTKAFDRISHYGLFTKLLECKLPLCLLYLIIFWHLNMSCKVKWGEAFSEEFPVPMGTKQGGISSPKFFALYINELAVELRQSGFGCHIASIFLGAILFADDVAPLPPRVLPC